MRQPEIKLNDSASSADLQQASGTIAYAMYEPIGRVVVIEDEPPVRDAVLAALRAERFTATGFEDLPRPRDVLAAAPDLAILDVLLPSGNGFELARSLRQRHELPIIFLTALDAVADRVAGLELGADDYLVKPFALEELMARVRAVLRRRGAIPQVLEVEQVLVDEEHGFATRAGRGLPLTSTELRLLAFLMRHRGQVLSKDQLLTQVWGYDSYDHNLVEVHISSLRRKLERDGVGGGRLIHTVRGIGYRFSP
ncbi:MAG TPA: response regulator transcription factor [Solirubrobacteraceae bacterium]|nr:response regulator transcription factor [Solirubrobacteraceae bacterium]